MSWKPLRPFDDGFESFDQIKRPSICRCDSDLLGKENYAACAGLCVMPQIVKRRSALARVDERSYMKRIRITAILGGEPL
jgi:hypothetical protein